MHITTEKREQIKTKILRQPMCCVYPWAIEFVLEAVKELPAGSVMLEMGTFVGGSTHLFALANPNISIHTVDLNQFNEFHDDPMLADIRNRYGLDELTAMDLYEIQKMHIEDYPNIVSHTGHSRSLSISNLDLVFVDAAHEYEEVLEDLRYSWNSLKDDGYILGDDVYAPNVYNAVWQFCQEVDVEYTIYSKCFKIKKSTKGNAAIRKEIEAETFVDFKRC
jgi:predicted O-methyltransferase YrrM